MTEKDNQTEILKEILKWIKVTSYNEVKQILNTVLETDAKKLIYQLSDGNNGQTEIVNKAKASSKSISKYWQEWEKVGLGESKTVGKGIRFTRSFDLRDFGFEINEKGGRQK